MLDPGRWRHRETSPGQFDPMGHTRPSTSSARVNRGMEVVVMREVEARGVRSRVVTSVRCGMQAGVVEMRGNDVMSLRPGACGLALRCLSGIVVVTQKGDREDHELHPGDEFRTSRRGLVVAWALEASVCAVSDLAGAQDVEPLRAA